MNRLSLIKNPELFQGEKYLESNKNYFEGWYFKNTNSKAGISFIPGINIDNKKKKAFIQVITTESSYYIDYNIDDFKFYFNPFEIKIEKNYFSKDNIHIDIEDIKNNLKINGDIEYINNQNINTNVLNPNIMGPFSYVPFMECNHAILSMKNYTKGFINVNNSTINFDNGLGYIEKDWGCSFPKSYVWCQGNNFAKTNASFMMSIANIPFKAFEFAGIICSLIIDDEEFRFATYNNTKLKEYTIDNCSLNITLQKGAYQLNIKSTDATKLKLVAPVKGKMEKDIFESITASINVTLEKNGNIIFSDTSTNCGIEIVE